MLLFVFSLFLVYPLPPSKLKIVTLSLRDPFVRFSLFAIFSAIALSLSHSLLRNMFGLSCTLVENFQLSQYQKWQTMRKCFFRSFYNRVLAVKKKITTVNPYHLVCIIFFGVFVSVSFTPVLGQFFLPFVRPSVRRITLPIVYISR